MNLSKTLQLSKWKMFLKTLPLVIAALVVRSIIQWFGWEVFPASSMLIGGTLTGVIFLIGFMLAGVLSDFKESEKLPDSIASSIKAINDQNMMEGYAHPEYDSRSLGKYLLELLDDILDWLHEKCSTQSVYEKVAGLAKYYAALEKFGPGPLLARVQSEQNTIRHGLTRIKTIRETSFIAAGYTIVELSASLLVIMLILTRFDQHSLSFGYFLQAFISTLVFYMVLLIRDMDNPFEYRNGGGSAEIDLMALNDARTRIATSLEQNFS